MHGAAHIAIYSRQCAKYRVAILGGGGKRGTENVAIYSCQCAKYRVMILGGWVCNDRIADRNDNKTIRINSSWKWPEIVIVKSS